MSSTILRENCWNVQSENWPFSLVYLLACSLKECARLFLPFYLLELATWAGAFKTCSSSYHIFHFITFICNYVISSGTLWVASKFASLNRSLGSAFDINFIIFLNFWFEWCFFSLAGGVHWSLLSFFSTPTNQSNFWARMFFIILHNSFQIEYLVDL